MKFLYILITTFIQLAIVIWLVKGWWNHAVVEDKAKQRKMLDNVERDWTP